METTMFANRMFLLLTSVQTQALVPTYFQNIPEDKNHLWHRSFEHLSFKGLKTLSYKKLVKGLPPLKASSKLCIDCMVGK